MNPVSSLKLYIYDYFSKQCWNVNTAKQFLLDAQLGSHTKPPIDAPQGFLFEWWTALWVHLPSCTDESAEGDYKLHVYIHEYLVKQGFHNTARTFLNELNISRSFNVTFPGHLLEYWSEFWRLFKEKRSRTAPSDTTMHMESRQQTQAETQLQQSHDGSTISMSSIGTRDVFSFADSSMAPVQRQVPLHSARRNELPAVQGPNASVAISNNMHPPGLPYQTQQTPVVPLNRNVYPHASSYLPAMPITGAPMQPFDGIHPGATLAAQAFPQSDSPLPLDILMQQGYGSGGGSLDLSMPLHQHLEQSSSALPSNGHNLSRRATIGDLYLSPYGIHNASNIAHASHGREAWPLPQHQASKDVAHGVETGTLHYEAERGADFLNSYSSQVQGNPILSPVCQSPLAMEDSEVLLGAFTGGQESLSGLDLYLA